MTAVNETLRTPEHHPDVVINQETLHRIEALAEGALNLNPALAEKLLNELVHAQIVASDRMPENIVAIGNDVTYRDEMTGQEKTVMLAFPKDADIARQRVSVMTPLGVALLGLAEGAVFYWDTRDGKRRMLTVIRVKPVSEE
ncbi:MAG: nucleoside diphosphate kinase regulator [Rhodospirillales bacterium]